MKDDDEEETGSVQAELVKGGFKVVERAYDDALAGPMQEVGRALTVAGKTVNIALAPLSGLVWGWDRLSVWLSNRVGERLRERAASEIHTPDPALAVPTIIALSAAAHHESLRELYANLLATSMDRQTAHLAHPAFVETIKQLNPDEALLIGCVSGAGSIPVIRMRRRNVFDDTFETAMPAFTSLAHESGCARPDLVSVYVENLARLALVDVRFDEWLSSRQAEYGALQAHPHVLSCIRRTLRYPRDFPELDRGVLSVTAYGHAFAAACLVGAPTAEHERSLAEGHEGPPSVGWRVARLESWFRRMADQFRAFTPGSEAGVSEGKLTASAPGGALMVEQLHGPVRLVITKDLVERREYAVSRYGWTDGVLTISDDDLIHLIRDALATMTAKTVAGERSR